MLFSNINAQCAAAKWRVFAYVPTPALTVFTGCKAREKEKKKKKRSEFYSLSFSLLVFS